MRTRDEIEKDLFYNDFGNSVATDQKHRDTQTMLLLDIRDLLQKQLNK